jgi:hypothetical protein
LQSCDTTSEKLNRDPVKVIVKEAYTLRYQRGRARVGSFKRKAKGREYTCPRILLRDYFMKHVGKDLLILEGKASIEGTIFQDTEVLLVFIKPSTLSSAR